MLKIILLFLFSIPLVHAQEALKAKKPVTRMSVEEVRKRCLQLEGAKKLKFESICKKAEEISKREQLKEKYPFMSLRAESDFLFTEYEIKEKSSGLGGNLVSKSHYNFGVKLLQHYSPSTKSYFGLNYQHLEFDNSLSKPLLNPKVKMLNFDAGILLTPISRLHLDFGLHYGDVFYIRPYGTQNLKVTKQLVPSGHVFAAYDVFSQGGVTFGIKGKLAYVLPFTSEDREDPQGNFKAKGSLNYGAEVYGRKQFQKWSLAGGLGVSERDMGTNYMEGKLRSVNVGVKVAIPFGWEGE